MTRIKVTGYLEVDDDDMLDPGDDTGLSQAGFEQLSNEFAVLEELDFVPVPE